MKLYTRMAHLSRPVGSAGPFAYKRRRLQIVGKEVSIGQHNERTEHFAPVAGVFIDRHDLYDERKR